MLALELWGIMWGIYSSTYRFTTVLILKDAAMSQKKSKDTKAKNKKDNKDAKATDKKNKILYTSTEYIL